MISINNFYIFNSPIRHYTALKTINFVVNFSKVISNNDDYCIYNFVINEINKIFASILVSTIKIGNCSVAINIMQL